MGLMDRPRLSRWLKPATWASIFSTKHRHNATRPPFFSSQNTKAPVSRAKSKTGPYTCLVPHYLPSLGGYQHSRTRNVDHKTLHLDARFSRFDSTGRTLLSTHNKLQHAGETGNTQRFCEAQHTLSVIPPTQFTFSPQHHQTQTHTHIHTQRFSQLTTQSSNYYQVL